MKTPFALALLFAVTNSSLRAAVVYTDFNDNFPGGLGSFTAGAGQGGGSGFLADDAWANTGVISVISGDLSAPASTNYAITQGSSVGNHSVQNQTNFTRHTTRATATTLGTANDVWFSFLLNQPTTNSRGGITFNQNTSAPSNPRVVATGTELRLGLGLTLQAVGQGANLLTLGETALILGQLTIDPVGDETLNIWINPDVSGGIAGLGAVDTSLSEQTASLEGGVTRVGVQSYASDSQGGIVDTLILSDDADPNQAFADVTGVLIPEPSTLFFSALSALGLLLRRR